MLSSGFDTTQKKDHEKSFAALVMDMPVDRSEDDNDEDEEEQPEEADYFSLNLEQKELGMLCSQFVAKYIFTHFPHPRCQGVNIGKNNLGDDGVLPLLPIITQASKFGISKMDLRSNDLTPVGFERIAGALASSDLKRIDISSISGFNKNQMGTKGGTSLGIAMRECTSLEEMRLSGVGGTGFYQLAKQAFENPETCNLRTLDVRCNWLPDKAFTKLCTALASTNVENLLLSKNPFSKTGAAALVQLISNSKLHLLDISSCDIAVRGSNALPDFYSTLQGALIRTRHLRTLLLDDNEVGSDGCKCLAAALAKQPNISLKTLSLVGCSISTDDAKSIGKALGHNTQLTKLNLKNNQIHDVGASAIADALTRAPGAKLSGIAHLNLAKVGLTDEFQPALVGIIQGINNLRTLDIQDNDITQKCGKVVQTVLERALLRSLHVQEKITGLIQVHSSVKSTPDEVKENLAECQQLLQQGLALTTLNVKNNRLHDSMVEMLEALLQQNRQTREKRRLLLRKLELTLWHDDQVETLPEKENKILDLGKVGQAELEICQQKLMGFREVHTFEESETVRMLAEFTLTREKIAAETAESVAEHNFIIEASKNADDHSKEIIRQVEEKIKSEKKMADRIRFQLAQFKKDIEAANKGQASEMLEAANQEQKLRQFMEDLIKQKQAQEKAYQLVIDEVKGFIDQLQKKLPGGKLGAGDHSPGKEDKKPQQKTKTENTLKPKENKKIPDKVFAVKVVTESTSCSPPDSRDSSRPPSAKSPVGSKLPREVARLPLIAVAAAQHTGFDKVGTSRKEVPKKVQANKRRSVAHTLGEIITLQVDVATDSSQLDGAIKVQKSHTVFSLLFHGLSEGSTIWVSLHNDPGSRRFIKQWKDYRATLVNQPRTEGTEGYENSFLPVIKVPASINVPSLMKTISTTISIPERAISGLSYHDSGGAKSGRSGSGHTSSRNRSGQESNRSSDGSGDHTGNTTDRSFGEGDTSRSPTSKPRLNRTMSGSPLPKALSPVTSAAAAAAALLSKDNEWTTSVARNDVGEALSFADSPRRGSLPHMRLEDLSSKGQELRNSPTNALEDGWTRADSPSNRVLLNKLPKPKGMSSLNTSQSTPDILSPGGGALKRNSPLSQLKKAF